MMPRSIHSNEKAYVRFINRTNRMVELIWLNFNGEYVRYQILRKDSYVDVNTYKTHPWIALDMHTKDRLHIDQSYVFNPRTSREYLEERFPNKQIPENFETRIRTYITLPLYSLKYRALMEIRDHFQNADDVDKLELPKQLSEDLKRTIEYRNSQVQREVADQVQVADQIQ